MTLEQDLSARIAGYFGAEGCWLLAKGRVGLYVGLRAMDLPRGAKILMPGYTCMVVPSAVQFAGLTPVYCDIDPETYNLDPRLLEQIDDPLAALIVQHTYGIPCEMDAIGGWAERHEVSIIEDCCHSFGSPFNSRLCGTFGKFAFMSGQWNKPFSTGLGGMLLVNDAVLAQRAATIIDSEGRRPGAMKNMLLAAQIIAYQALVRPSTTAALMGLYRVLGKMGLVAASSSNEELRGTMPDGYLTKMAPCQIRKGLREMARIEENIAHRRKLTQFYQRELPGIGFAAISDKVPAGLPLLRYPVRVANKPEVLAKAMKHGVEIGSWFEIPLHPEGTRMEKFGYRPGMCPEAERASREVVNLPTHLRVNEATAAKTLVFLKNTGRPT
jgi:perosamine synthetase